MSTRTSSLRSPSRPSVDPITFEIVRHRLFRIMDEGIITLKHVTGSAITTEAHDVVVALYRADGELLMGGTGFLHHLIPATEACRLILRRFGDQIYQGDVFMVNDPYVSALHTSDVFVVTPIHYDGELVAWTACFVHVYDIGAINAGGFSPDARSVYAEGFSTQGLKLVERGEVRRDVMDTILNMVRVPEMVALDFSSMIACGNVVRRRMTELMDKYGADTLDDVGVSLIDQSEKLLRLRLRELQDGRWETRQYIDVLGETFRINLAMTKREDTLTFDFTGSSPQSDTYGINCSYWASLGGLFAPLFPLLCHDMTWNAGLIRPVSMIAPEGTVVNALRPAPTGIATISAVQSINNASSQVISKMLLTSEEYEEEATGVWHGNLLALFLFGTNQKGLEVIGIQTETFSGSGGARTFADGVDFGGELANPITRMSNVETVEATFPVRYLFRRRMCDSAGAGRFRGGAGGEYALMLHDAPAGLHYNLTCKGLRHTVADGIAGGYPGCPCLLLRVRENSVPFARSLDEITGEREPVSWGVFPLVGTDVLYVRWSGGGGFGDPMLREAERVASDYSAGVVSRDAAEAIYGVVLDEKLGSAAETATRRQRREHAARHPNAKNHVAGRLRMSPMLEVRPAASESRIVCSGCGHKLTTTGGPWKPGARLVETPVNQVGGIAYTSGDELMLRCFFCPQCDALLDTETAVVGDPFLNDILLT
jgi:N-methylhydantoinase B